MKRTGIIFAMMGVLSALAWASMAGPNDNLVFLHKEAKAHAADCTGCHGDRKTETGTDGKTKSSHTLHLTSLLLRFNCVSCHQSVDLREGSAANLRKQVNPEFCARCHSALPTVKAHTEKAKTMCAKCHAGWRKQMAESAPDVALDKVGTKDCYGCHGGRKLFVQEKAKHHHHGGHSHGR